MAGVHVSHGIGDLSADMERIAARVRPDMRGVVRDGLKVGNGIAKVSAKRQAGKPGKHYHKSFTTEMHSGLGLFGNTISGEYGPDISRMQGGMKFEGGEGRQTTPHLNLARSTDVVGPAFLRSVDDQVGDWFW